MVTALVGRAFLAHYNQKNKDNLSAKEFFERHYFKLFYNHSKYMQWVGNSPFVQMKKGQKPHLLTSAERLEKLSDLHKKIKAGATDASIAIGYPASEESEYATTSGQVTDLSLTTSEETVYCSWIGSGLGIGVAGGQLILFDHPLIFDALFAGWQYYRDFLNDPAYDNLPGNKINSWNGQWLSHVFSDEFNEHSPLRGFANKVLVAESGKDIEIKPQSWLNVLLSIASQLAIDSLTGYIYKMGQTNSTYGFIPFQLTQLQRPEQIYVRLFGEGSYQNDRDKIRAIYGSAKSFQRICEMGAVGVAALEPKGLRDIMQGGRYKPTDEITFKTYITWLLAMLNNNEFWDEAGHAADLLIRYETYVRPDRERKDLSLSRQHQVNDLLSASNQPKFMAALVPIMESADAEMKEELEKFAHKVYLISRDNFSYFNTLVHLRYVRQS
ncbi:hypothetical protein GCM10028806_09630 [Spirosoma terrae]|uniref:Uncharacterized protein n=1 Tax=Spirosoma terrae TaxID=1968276 RepID=A0A6L9L5L1_9BACT|nr:hypothetical protein [Spirosoma terrae]NDU95895.1 hypothetical protein [Spirosoma terrae]